MEACVRVVLQGTYHALPGGSDADGTEYAGALSQRVFRTIASAADDMAAVFGDDAPELSSLLVVWALQACLCLCSTAFDLMHAVHRLVSMQKYVLCLQQGYLLHVHLAYTLHNVLEGRRSPCALSYRIRPILPDQEMQRCVPLYVSAKE